MSTATESPPRVKLPAELRPEMVTVLTDTREQCRWDLSPMLMEPATLPTGDYTLSGLQSEVIVERKEFGDFLNCIGSSRKRFDEEITRMRGYPNRIVIVEASYADLLAGDWRHKVSLQAARNSVLGWCGHGVPIHFSGSRAEAQRDAFEFLYLMARRYWKRLRQFAT